MVGLEAEVNENQYLGVGFGTDVAGGMKNTDMITFEAGGDGKIHDQYSKGKYPPPNDASDDIKQAVIKKVQVGSKMKFKFTCYRELTNSDTTKDF